MKERIITALVLIFLFLPILVIGGWPFQALVAIAAILTLAELLAMRNLKLLSAEGITASLAIVALIYLDQLQAFIPFLTGDFILLASLLILLVCLIFSKAVTNISDVLLVFFGISYFGNAFKTAFDLRELGLLIMIYILMTVWATDTFAYFIGMKFGRHKLAPHISPNKTIEGSLGGTLVALVIGVIVFQFLPVQMEYWRLIVLTLFISLSGQMGDLIESSIKRYYNVKDSGSILPGHGGLFDRLDSVIFVMNVVSLLMSINFI